MGWNISHPVALVNPNTLWCIVLLCAFTAPRTPVTCLSLLLDCEQQEGHALTVGSLNIPQGLGPVWAGWCPCLMRVPALVHNGIL